MKFYNIFGDKKRGSNPKILTVFAMFKIGQRSNKSVNKKFISVVRPTPD